MITSRGLVAIHRGRIITLTEICARVERDGVFDVPAMMDLSVPHPLPLRGRGVRGYDKLKRQGNASMHRLGVDK